LVARNDDENREAEELGERDDSCGAQNGEIECEAMGLHGPGLVCDVLDGAVVEGQLWEKKGQKSAGLFLVLRADFFKGDE
jgi:hypothetical protein